MKLFYFCLVMPSNLLKGLDLVHRAGFEPATLGVSSRCYYQSELSVQGEPYFPGANKNPGAFKGSGVFRSRLLSLHFCFRLV